jgi:hypothetical protein
MTHHLITFDRFPRGAMGSIVGQTEMELRKVNAYKLLGGKLLVYSIALFLHISRSYHAVPSNQYR